MNIDILATPLTSASVLYGLYDTLSSPGAAWPRIVEGKQSPPSTRVRIISPSKNTDRLLGGLPVEPHAGFDDPDPGEVLCLTNIRIAPDDDPHGLMPETVAYVRRRYGDGATIASVCSGAILLAEAGLLDGHEATSHWGYEVLFRRNYPAVRYRPGRVLTFAGEGDRLVMAGGLSSWQNLSLYLIARFLGPEQASQTARIYCMSGVEGDPRVFAAPSRRTTLDDPAIAECQLWLAENYAAKDALASVIARSGLARRTFSRRFEAATGYAPLAYLQALRIEEAKQLLETTDAPIDEIAPAIGYDDARSLRRMFSQRTGSTPAEYRRRFSRTRFTEAR